MSSFYNEEELKSLGLKKCGKGVLISRKCSVYAPDQISVGDCVRIDDFCILSGNITIGNNVHIAAYTALFGGNIGIEMCDFSGISSHSSIYAASDDYSGEYMTNPMIPEQYRNVYEKKVYIGKHVIIGSHSVILPGSVLEEGVSIGAMTLVKNYLDGWGIYVGVPCRKIGERKRELLGKEKDFKKLQFICEEKESID